MNRFVAFLKTTLLGGVLLVLPAWFAGWLLAKAVSQLQVMLKPLTAKLPAEVAYPGVAAVLVLTVVCFLVGLAVRTAIGARIKGFAEERLLNKLPGYSTLRGFAVQLTKFESSTQFQPALIEFDDALVPGFFVEGHPDDRCTVFVPSVPTPLTGSLYILANSRVHRLNLPTMAVMHCLSKWGAGSSALVAAFDGQRERVGNAFCRGEVGGGS